MTSPVSRARRRAVLGVVVPLLKELFVLDSSWSVGQIALAVRTSGSGRHAREEAR